MVVKYPNDDRIDTRLKVVSWNLWWRYGPWRERQPAIIETLKALDADVLGIQEIWRDEQTNAAAVFAEVLGFHHIFISGKERDGYGFGNAILSRWPIERSESSTLSAIEGQDEGRVAVHALIDGPRGPIPLFSTHLNWKYQHSAIRQRQVADLAGFVDRLGPWPYPPIVCGDFNAEPSSDEIRAMKGLTAGPVDDLFFHDAWAVAGDGESGYTWDNDNHFAEAELEPDRRIDYIFVGEPQACGAGHILDCRIVGDRPASGVWPSDHYGLIAELRY